MEETRRVFDLCDFVPDVYLPACLVSSTFFIQQLYLYYFPTQGFYPEVVRQNDPQSQYARSSFKQHKGGLARGHLQHHPGDAGSQGRNPLPITRQRSTRQFYYDPPGYS